MNSSRGNGFEGKSKDVDCLEEVACETDDRKVTLLLLFTSSVALEVQKVGLEVPKSTLRERGERQCAEERGRLTVRSWTSASFFWRFSRAWDSAETSSSGVGSAGPSGCDFWSE